MRRPATSGPMRATGGWRPGRGRRGSTGPNCRSRAWCGACRAATAGPRGATASWPRRCCRPAALAAVPGVEPGLDPHRAARCGWPPTPARTASPAGATGGWTLLDSFLTARGEPYRAAMSSPLTGERACSRLSPHLALGTLSVREVVQATAARQAERPGGRWGGALASFQSRLAWRDHFIQKLEDQPVDRDALTCTAPTEGLRPRDSRRGAAGGLGNGRNRPALSSMPACAICAATGWLNFRMRGDGDVGRVLSPVAGLAGDAGACWRGCSPITSPASTGRRCRCSRAPRGSTPSASTTRSSRGWIRTRPAPSPAAGCRNWPTVPDAFLQEPWKWPGAQRPAGAPLSRADGRRRRRRPRRARAVWGLRSDRGFAAEAAAIVDAPCQPRRRHGRFVNDRAPRRARPRRSAQMSLDL